MAPPQLPPHPCRYNQPSVPPHSTTTTISCVHTISRTIYHLVRFTPFSAGSYSDCKGYRPRPDRHFHVLGHGWISTDWTWGRRHLGLAYSWTFPYLATGQPPHHLCHSYRRHHSFPWHLYCRSSSSVRFYQSERRPPLRNGSNFDWEKPLNCCCLFFAQFDHHASCILWRSWLLIFLSVL